MSSCACGRVPVVASGLCNRCYQRQWRETNTARTAGYRSKHSTKYHGDPTYRAAWLARSSLTSRKSRYGITPEGFLARLESQRNACAMCAEVFSSQSAAHVDHDHDTEKVRGLLCMSCNTSLGHYERVKDRAESYLASQG